MNWITLFFMVFVLFALIINYHFIPYYAPYFFSALGVCLAVMLLIAVVVAPRK